MLNLASADLVAAVNRLALTTGMNPVPAYKQAIGTESVSDKFGRAGLNAVPSDLVAPPRVQECQIALEAKVRRINDIGNPEQFLSAIDCNSGR